MENKYKKYKGFWYNVNKNDKTLPYWRISINETGDSDEWVFDMRTWTLSKAIEKIKQDNVYEKESISLIQKFGASNFLEAIDRITKN